MKKYRVTGKHEFLKEGIILESYSYRYNSLSRVHVFDKDDLDVWLKNSWIEEIQEPEFTRSDVIKILHSYDDYYVLDSKSCNFNDVIDKFKNK